MLTHHYFSYLIRIWQADDQLPGNWYASLEDPTSHSTILFTTLDELFEFIRNKSLSEENVASEKNH
jgi:hypothetical protein